MCTWGCPKTGQKEHPVIPKRARLLWGSVCINRKRGARSIDLPPAKLLLEGSLLTCSTLFPQRVINLSLSKDKKHLLAQWQRNINQLTFYRKRGGDIFLWSSTFSQFHTALPNLGFQMRCTHLSLQPTPRWYGDYVNLKEFETFNKNQLFLRVSAEPPRFPLWVNGLKAREEKGWAGKNLRMFTIWTLPLSECQGRWTRSSHIPYSRQEHLLCKQVDSVYHGVSSAHRICSGLSRCPAWAASPVNMQPLFRWCREGTIVNQNERQIG